MVKIKLIYKSVGWISLYDHECRNFVLTFRESKIINVPEDRVHFYNGFKALGVEVIILDSPRKEVVEEVVQEVIDEILQDLVTEEPIVEKPDIDLPAYDEVKKMSKAEIKELLRGLNIEYNNSDTKSELLERLGVVYGGK